MGKYTSKYTGQEIDDRLDAVSGKQDALVSGTNIKTVNGTSLLGSGNIAIEVDSITNAEIEALFVEVTLISFTFGDTTYQAEEGMTWGEWVASEYNTDGFTQTSPGIYIYGPHGEEVRDALHHHLVSASDEIVANATYISGGSNL